MRRSVLALALAASTLTATPSGFFHPLWNLLFGHWSESSSKAGAGWDPWGRSLTAPQSTTKAGPGADPDGLLAAPPQTTDAGAGADPWGSH